MAASLVSLSQQQSSLALQWNYKPAPFGTYLSILLLEISQTNSNRIYRPVKTATQSGTWHSHAWKMDWDPLPKGYRWENPLMGWQSSADFMQGESVAFKTKEDAINFANKQGYEYYVQEPNERRILPKAYANNFLHEPKKLKHIRTK